MKRHELLFDRCTPTFRTAAKLSALLALLISGNLQAHPNYSSGPPAGIVKAPTNCTGCHSGGVEDDNSLVVTSPPPLPAGTTSTTLSVVGGTANRNTWTVFDNKTPTKSRTITVNGLSTGTKLYSYCILDAATTTFKRHNCGTTSVTVLEPDNRDPVVTADPTSDSIEVGSSIGVKVSSSDPDGQQVTVTAKSSAPGVATVSSNPDSSGRYTVTGIAEGRTTITFTGRDSKGAIDTATTQITVTKKPPPTGGNGAIGFAKAEYRVREGDLVEVGMERSGGASGEVVVDIQIRGITATGGSDFQRAEGNPTDFNVSRRWIDGEVLDRTSGGLKTVNLQILLDGLAGEGVETLELEMTNISGGSFAGTTKTTLFIEDLDTPQSGGTISFDKAEYRVTEGDRVDVGMIRSAGSSGEVVVDIQIRGITATGGSDFQRAEGNPTDFNVSRRWLDGEVLDRTTGGLKTVNIQTLIDNASAEGTETLELAMTDINGASIGQPSITTIYIKDSDDGGSGNSCVYPGGDTTQWGWDSTAGQSCPPTGTEPPPVTPPQTGNCVYPGGDTTQWGWDNVAGLSCPPGDTPPTTPPQTNNCVYPGGDTSQWGWDSTAGLSCPPGDTPPTTPPQSDNCAYPGGDTTQWGWDSVAGQSCAPAGSTTNPFTPTDNCVYPAGDTTQWGWDSTAGQSCAPL